MPTTRIALNLVALFGFVLYSVATVPVQAGAPQACDAAKTNIFIAAGDRFEAHRQYGDAALRYLAASRATRDCRTAADVLVGSRSLAKAGSALALRGEYLKALALLRAAQARLAALPVGDTKTASAAGTLSDRVHDLIVAIDRVAQSTM